MTARSTFPKVVKALSEVTREQIDEKVLASMVDAIGNCEDVIAQCENVRDVVADSCQRMLDGEGDELDAKVMDTATGFFLKCYQSPTLTKSGKSPSQDKYLCRWRTALQDRGLTHRMITEKPSPKEKAEVTGFEIVPHEKREKSIDDKYKAAFKTLQKIRAQMDQAQGKRYDELSVAAIQRGAAEL